MYEYSFEETSKKEMDFLERAVQPHSETVAKLDEIALNWETSRRNVGKSYVEVMVGPRERQDREFCNVLIHLNYQHPWLTLHQLLATHPAKEMGASLLKQILDGDVCLSKKIYGTDDTLFKPFFDTAPFIIVRSHLLRPGRERYAQLVLYHEYIHYKQWLAGRIWKGMDANKKIEELNPEKRIDRCKEIWYAEREAYHMECELALSSTVQAELTFCAGVQNGSAVAIEEHLMSVHDWSVTCSSEWQSLSTGR